MTRWMLAAALVVLAALAAGCGTDETNSANAGGEQAPTSCRRAR